MVGDLLGAVMRGVADDEGTAVQGVEVKVVGADRAGEHEAQVRERLDFRVGHSLDAGHDRGDRPVGVRRHGLPAVEVRTERGDEGGDLEAAIDEQDDRRVAAADGPGRRSRVGRGQLRQDRADTAVDDVGAVPEGGAMPEALEQMEVTVGCELRHLTNALRWGLHVLREGDGVDRHGDRGSRSAES